MNVSPIPDREAADLLGVSYATIRNAVKRGDLMRVPMAGQIQHVAKEQVLLFKGKKQIRISALSREELRIWELLADLIKQQSTPIAEHVAQLQPAATTVTPMIDAEAFARALLKNGATINFQSAPQEKSDQSEQAGTPDYIAMALLVGLVLILWANKDEIAQQIQAVLKKIGLKTEDVKTNPQEVKDIISLHPDEARELAKIIDNAGAWVA